MDLAIVSIGILRYTMPVNKKQTGGDRKGGA